MLLPRLIPTLCIPVLAALLLGCGDKRTAATQAELTARLAKTSQHNRELYQQVVSRMVARLETKLAAGQKPDINILMLSGGAEWGAFGSGFLNAWSKIPANDQRAMPQFDLVTGISTGALIAPYAFIGDAHALNQIDNLYRQSKPSYSEQRLWSFLIHKRGLYDISELEKMIRTDLEATVIPGLHKIDDKNRTVLVASADMDLGLLHLWDLKQESADIEHMYSVQRAAIAIPGAFDPVEIDGSLHADAGVLMQFIALTDPETLAKTMIAWNTAHPQRPARIRQWVIINNKPHEPLATVQHEWTDSLPRSMALMVKSGVISPLTTMTLQAEILRAHGMDIELRWISIPADLAIDPKLPPFDSRITIPLSDLGRKEGASQTGWHTDPPRPTEREAGETTLEPDTAKP